jgi:EmrB/QacA subfamily drug resistance transporter
MSTAVLHRLPARAHYYDRDSSDVLLVLVCLAQFMVILDVSIVNVALPSIRDGLHFSTTGLQWVVNAYTLTFAGFLLLGGRASDLLGRRRVFMSGIALFVVSSLACALASSRGLLITARTLQGLGGAIISPASLAIITTSFAEGHARNRALGVWGAIGGIGGATGVLLGGALTQTLGWPSIFFINVPVGLAVLLLTPAIVPEGRRMMTKHHFDLAGALLVTGGLMLIVYGIVGTDTHSWGSAGVLGPIALGMALLVGFLAVEGRFSRAPLMPLGIFHLRTLRAANLIVFLLGSALFAMWFILSLYLQQVLHLDALQTGFAFLPMTLGIVLGASQAPHLVGRLGVRVVITTGMLSSTAGLALLSGVRPGASYFVHVLPGGLLAAIGMGLALVPATIVAVQGVPGRQSGLASGLINTSRLMGGALGLAVLSTIAATHTRTQLLAGVGAQRATSDGYQLAFAAGSLLCLLGALSAVTLIRTHASVNKPSLAEDGERPRRHYSGASSGATQM